MRVQMLCGVGRYGKNTFVSIVEVGSDWFKTNHGLYLHKDFVRVID
jgi:hypothetical protein